MSLQNLTDGRKPADNVGADWHRYPAVRRAWTRTGWRMDLPGGGSSVRSLVNLAATSDYSCHSTTRPSGEQRLSASSMRRVTQPRQQLGHHPHWWFRNPIVTVRCPAVQSAIRPDQGRIRGMWGTTQGKSRVRRHRARGTVQTDSGGYRHGLLFRPVGHPPQCRRPARPEPATTHLPTQDRQPIR